MATTNDIPALVAAVRVRLAAATPGPWKWRADAIGWFMTLAGVKLRMPNLAPDGALIASAPADLAALCDAVERFADDAMFCSVRSLEWQARAEQAEAALAELVRQDLKPQEFSYEAMREAWAEARRIVGETGGAA